jgi:outer membrane receptor for monomeric catechols
MDRMTAGMLRTIAVAAICISSAAFAVAGEGPRHARASIQGPAASSRSTDTLKPRLRASNAKQDAAWTRAADSDPYVDPAAPYKANRLSSSRGEAILNTPGQTTVLTRQVLDDMNATSLRDALRSTAGVTVGR